MKFWIWVYSRFSCKRPLKLLSKRPRLKHKNWCKSVICWPILMKFCVQPPIRHPFALANFQLGRKGQRPKGRKVKRPNFQKLSEAFLIKSKVVPDVFMSIFKLKGPISRNFALELIVPGLCMLKSHAFAWLNAFLLKNNAIWINLFTVSIAFYITLLPEGLN